MAETQRSVYEHLGLYRSVAGYESYLLQRQLSCKDSPGYAHLSRGFHPGKIMYAHLGARMYRQIRQCLPYGRCKPEILHENSVSPCCAHSSCGFYSLGKLSVIHKGVQGHIYFAPAYPAVSYSLEEFLI